MINKHTDSWDVLLDVSPGQEIGAPAVQRGLMRRDEIIQAVNAVMRGICCPVLTAEEVYGRGFTVKDPLTQVKIWKQYYPDLDGSCVEEIIKWIDLPCESDGFAVIPKLDIFAPDYFEMAQKILELFPKTNEFAKTDYSELYKAIAKNHGDERLYLSTDLREAHEALNKQPGDFWVFPYQFGRLKYGIEHDFKGIKFEKSEFGLGTYEVICLLLTHPRRLYGFAEPVDCPGIIREYIDDDEFCSITSQEIKMRDSENIFAISWEEKTNKLVYMRHHDLYWASATGWLP